MPLPREVQPPSPLSAPTRLHISTPGIGVDGERGYNSSHCIGSSRVIGPSLPVSSWPPLSPCPGAHTILNPFVPHPPIVSHFLKARRECVLCRSLCPNLAIYRHCGQLRRLCRFVPFQPCFGLSAPRIRPLRECIPRGWTIPITASSILRNKRLRQSITILCKLFIVKIFSHFRQTN